MPHANPTVEPSACYVPELDPRNQPKRYVKLRPPGFGSWAIMEPKEADAMLAVTSVADECDYEIAEVLMTQAEFEALPDHGGW